MNINRIVYSNTKTTTLTNSVMLYSAMLSKNMTIKINNITRNRRLIRKQNIKIFFADKILTFFTVSSFKICLSSKFKNFTLFHCCKRETNLFKSCRRNTIKEVSLIFRNIHSCSNHTRTFAASKNTSFRTNNLCIVTSTEVIIFDI